MTELAYFGLSDKGLKRTKNEDYLSYKDNLMLIADGVGGEYGGEIASRLACETISKEFFPLLQEHKKPALALEFAIKQANRNILAEIAKQEQNMATTICALYIHNNIAFYTHLGDSRIYLVRGGKIKRLTSDHKLGAQDNLKANSNVITNALGIKGGISFKINQVYIKEGDIFFSATDGLTGSLNDSEIEEILRATSDIEQVVNNLVEETNNRGGPDNVTVGLVKVLKTNKKHLQPTRFIIPAFLLISAFILMVRLIEIRNKQVEELQIREDIKLFLNEKWKSAWEDFNVYEILNLYTNSTKATREMDNDSLWNKYRAQESSKIEISDIVVKKQPLGFNASFTQHFSSENFDETTTINMTLLLEDGVWKITEEKEGTYRSEEKKKKWYRFYLNILKD